MKRIHLVFLIVTAIVMLCSAYSLAEMSQVRYIDFQCFSSNEKVFKNEERVQLQSFEDSKWTLDIYPDKREIKLITNSSEFNKENSMDLSYLKLRDNFFEKSILMYCNMGTRFPLVSKAKVLEMAQRGNTVEIKINLETGIDDISKIGGLGTENVDVVKIDKQQIHDNKEICFIFKDQNNMELFRQNCSVN